MSDIIFTEGVFVKEGKFNEGNNHLKLGIKVEEFAQFVKDHQKEGGWLNLEIKTGKGGKPYCCLDTFVPKAQEEQSEPKAEEVDTSGDLPF